MEKKFHIEFNTKPMTSLEAFQIGLVLFKFANFITWPWWKVLIPIWIMLAISAISLIYFKIIVKKYKRRF